MDVSQEAELVQRLPLADGSRAPPFEPTFRLVRLAGDGLVAAREKRCHWAEVLEATELLPSPEGGASTKLVRLDIGGLACGNYYAGDEVSIYAENEASLVLRFAAHLGIEDLDDMFLLQAVAKVRQGRGAGSRRAAGCHVRFSQS